MAKNPNNPASKAAADNRANQLNPDAPAHASSRKHDTSGDETSDSDEE